MPACASEVWARKTYLHLCSRPTSSAGDPHAVVSREGLVAAPEPCRDDGALGFEHAGGRDRGVDYCGSGREDGSALRGRSTTSTRSGTIPGALKVPWQRDPVVSHRVRPMAHQPTGSSAEVVGHFRIRFDGHRSAPPPHVRGSSRATPAKALPDQPAAAVIGRKVGLMARRSRRRAEGY